MPLEFIIGLTEHRSFGYLYQAFLIEKKISFYTINKLVKQRDIETLGLSEEQAKLVRLVEQYSDEKLVQLFSKKKESGKFFQQIDPDLFENQISPYIDKFLGRINAILQKGNTRLFLKQAKYSNLYDEDLISVPEHYTECCFCFNRDDEGTNYRLEITDNGKILDLTHKHITIVANEPGAFLYQSRLYIFEKLSAKKLLPFLEKKQIFIASSVEEKYYRTFVANTIKQFPVKATGFQIYEKDSEKEVFLSLEPNLRMEAILLPKFKYGANQYLAGNKNDVLVEFDITDRQYRFNKISRDKAWEQEKLQQLKQIGLKEDNGSYYPPAVELLDEKDRLFELIGWLNRHKSKLQEAGFRLTQNTYNSNYSTEEQKLDIQISESEDWFDVYAKVQFGDYQIPFIKLKRHILNGIREFELPNGQVAVLPQEWFTEYSDLIPLAKTDGQHLRFSKFHYELLQERLKGVDKSFFNRIQEINTKPLEQAAVPSNLKATLRAYQHEGFSWMYKLHLNQFGGCLADDMGLGKTLQTLTLLLKLKRLKRTVDIPAFDLASEPGNLFSQSAEPNEEESKTQSASLIVMPTSLLHNWHNEIQKFTPSLKVYKHFGIQRKRNTSLKSIAAYYDVIITSYGTVRNDYEKLKDIKFFYLILDESQYIKNPLSKTYQTISELSAQYKLALTGTPIENSLADLWAQMNFINKGLLGNLSYFKREFITPIEKKNDPDKQQKLQTLIRPFVLRRTKEQVADDLPPITEQIRYCAMAKDQKRAYEQEKSAIRNSILESIEHEGMEKSAFVVLQGLTKLRQLANHPSMLQGNDDTESGKFDEIINSLESLIAEKHKVLIFSSFVKHLELVKTKIEERGWKYALLTGQTSNREDVIKSFQEDPENRIFLISLKAGGVGLNLTSADYVFIIDPWWNPASEMQAVSRAHRIGQNKKVMVYRFITEASIEEKILQLQERKSSLAEKFINSNNPFKAITKEEILSLFS